MTINELIERIGSDKVRFQWIDDCTTHINWDAKSGLTTVTLKTDQPITEEGFRDLGLLVWLWREEAQQLLTEARREAERDVYDSGEET